LSVAFRGSFRNPQPVDTAQRKPSSSNSQPIVIKPQERDNEKKILIIPTNPPSSFEEIILVDPFPSNNEKKIQSNLNTSSSNNNEKKLQKTTTEAPQRIESPPMQLIDPFGSLNREESFTSSEPNILDPVGRWINKPFKKWTLLYQWTKDGKSNKIFHEKCDNKGPTVTVVHANGGYIFGGFADLPWSSPLKRQKREWKESKDSFLFSITDNEKKRQPYQCLSFQNYHKAMLHSQDDGPTFGCHNGFMIRHDLCLNLNQSTIESELGGTYRTPEGYESTKFLAGFPMSLKIEEVYIYLI